MVNVFIITQRDYEKGENIMPYSSLAGKQKLFEYIVTTIPVESKIIDIGAGSGWYYDYLIEHNYLNMDAIEAFEPYIEKFKLRNKYDNVYLINALDFDYSKGKYDVVILGDILEHLSEEKARVLLDKIFPYVKIIIVSVPYNCVQGIEYGNILETHLQPDLTKEKFEKLYPEFRCIADDTVEGFHVGVWVWEKKE